MASTSEIYEGEQPQNYTMNWVDIIVMDTFDELVSEVFSGTKFHPSEEYNRDPRFMRKQESKIYDVINSYHGFCKLCDDHFYTGYDSRDINCFFQDHVNTAYHKELRTVVQLPDNTPMFTWEEKYKTATCNVCQMSGLYAFINMLRTDPMKTLMSHICVINPKTRETNSSMLAKINLLRKYCGLKIFREKLIRAEYGGVFCLMCCEKLPWSLSQAKCHLTSNSHYRMFIDFLLKCFHLHPAEVLNGFNLELVTRAVILRHPPNITSFRYCDYRTICFQQSNVKHKSDDGFSPKRRESFLMNEENDLIGDHKCLLCDTEVNGEHLKSLEHRERVQNMRLSSFGGMRNYALFCQNRIKRLRMLEVLEKLDSGMEEREKKNSEAKFVRHLLEERRRLADLLFTMTDDHTAYCHVCDENFNVAQEFEHVNGDRHVQCQKLWKEVRKDLENPKYTEPFQSFKNDLFCHLCGVIFQPSQLFIHIIGMTHIGAWEWYRSLNLSTSISSALYLKRDLTCTCFICKNVIIGAWSKVDLKQIPEHWPCPKLKEAHQKLAESCSNAEQREAENEKIEKVVENLVGVLQDKLMKDAYDHAVFLTDQMKELTLVKPMKTSEEGQLVEIEHEIEPSERSDSEADSSGADSRPEYSVSPTSEGAEGHSVLTRVDDEEEPRAQSSGAPRRKASKKRAQGKSKWVREVLVATGIPKIERTPKNIFKIFEEVGDVLCVAIEKSAAVVVFSELDMAQRVAKNMDFANKYKLNMSASKRKIYKAVAQVPRSLDQELVQLFLNVNSLTERMVQLSMEADRILGSVEEKQSEEMVCNTIRRAVASIFPEGKCYPFGSRLSGLTFRNSDLDIFLDAGNMFAGFSYSSPAALKKMLTELNSALRRDRDIVVLNVVSRARVPIISFLHLPTGIQCDISFKNGLSVHNTELIRDMISLDWRVKPLILLLKHWAKCNGLHGPPEFSSYAISMLVIFYLEQLKYPILPAIETLQNTAELPRITIAGWDCTITSHLNFFKDNDNEDTLPQLLLGLFEFYASFDYATNVISPLTGRPVPRALFSKSGFSQLPWSYKRQILNLPLPLENLVDSNIPICIIDPFDLGHVLTKSFGEKKLEMFIHFCNESIMYLTKGIEDMK